MLYMRCVRENRFLTLLKSSASLVAQSKNPSAMQQTWVQFLGWEHPLEKEMATHSSTLAWKNPCSRCSLSPYPVLVLLLNKRNVILALKDYSPVGDTDV